jgi:hypothetical protein
MRAAALALGAALLAGGAAAQTVPQLHPTRDVSVSYRGLGGAQEQAVTLTIAWLAASRTMRMDVPAMGWSVTDLRVPSGFIVIEAERRIMPLPPAALARQLGPSPAARFTREGTLRIAGQSCTQWRYEEADNDGQICLTADGVMLRSQGRMGVQSGGVEAVQVTYAAQDPARFVAPEGYQAPRAPRERPAR